MSSVEKSIRSYTIHAPWTWPRATEQSFNFSKATFFFFQLKLLLFRSRCCLGRAPLYLLLLRLPLLLWYRSTSLWSKAKTKHSHAWRVHNTHMHNTKLACRRHSGIWPQIHQHTHRESYTTLNHLINIPDKAKPYSTHLIFLLSRKINSCHCPPSRTKRLFTLTRFANKALHQDWQPPKLSASATAW